VSDVPTRIDESKNWFEQAAEHVPGYKGYKQKELRREADRLQREYVGQRLELARRKLEELELALSRSASLDLLGIIDTTNRKLRTVKDRFLYADYGYAGLFDAVKVDETVLDQLYQFDVQSQEQARAVELMVGVLNAESPSLRSDIALLDGKVEALDEYFLSRQHLVTGVGRPPQ
jgi:hypothetical protein